MCSKNSIGVNVGDVVQSTSPLSVNICGHGFRIAATCSGVKVDALLIVVLVSFTFALLFAAFVFGFCPSVFA